MWIIEERQNMNVAQFDDDDDDIIEIIIMGQLNYC